MNKKLPNCDLPAMWLKKFTLRSNYKVEEENEMMIKLIENSNGTISHELRTHFLKITEVKVRNDKCGRSNLWKIILHW